MHKKGKLNRKTITNGFKKQDNIYRPFHEIPADTFYKQSRNKNILLQDHYHISSIQPNGIFILHIPD